MPPPRQQLRGDLDLLHDVPDLELDVQPPVEARSAELSGNRRTRELWFDTSLWRDPATGRVVSAQAPFTLRSFPTRFPDVRFQALKNIDLTLFKDFRLTEALKLNVRAECYNATNTPWFPRLDTASVTAANFGSLNLAQTNTVRRFILAVRLLW